MAEMTPQQFIEQTLIEDVGYLVKKGKHYIAFAIMAIGIEVLGKCLNSKNVWNDPSGSSRSDFKNAIDELDAFKDYKDKNLYDNLRNGFAHFLAPKSSIILSSGKEDFHLKLIDGKLLYINCEDFYKDFARACNETVSKKFHNPNKMNQPFLVTEDGQNPDFSTYSTSASAFPTK